MQIDILFSDDACMSKHAAQTLRAAVLESRPHWDVRIHNLSSFGPTQSAAAAALRMAQQWGGNAEQRAISALLGPGPVAQRVLCALKQAAMPHLVRALRRHWILAQPDVVVNLATDCNEWVGASIAGHDRRVPMVSWVGEQGLAPVLARACTRQHLVTASERVALEAKHAGLPAHQVHRVSGLWLPAQTHKPDAQHQAMGRRSLGLRPHAPTLALVPAAGAGAGELRALIRHLADWQLVVAADSTHPNLHDLAHGRNAPLVVVDAEDDPTTALRLANVVLAQANPVLLAMAAQLGRPAVTLASGTRSPQRPAIAARSAVGQRSGWIARDLTQLPKALAQAACAAVHPASPGNNALWSAQHCSQQALADVTSLIQRLALGSQEQRQASTLHSGERQPHRLSHSWQRAAYDARLSRSQGSALFGPALRNIRQGREGAQQRAV